MEVNKKRLSEIFGVSIRTIQNWQDQGMPVARGGGKGNEVLYDSAAVIEWYSARDAAIENEKLRKEVEQLRVDSESDLVPGTIDYERHRLTRAQADAQELKNAKESAEVVETAFCTFVLSRIYNITGDGAVGSYVNAVGGAWYNGNWSLGGVRGSGTNLDRAQLNVNSGTGTAGSFLFYPDERFKSSSCGANGAGYGGSWSDINTWQRNISFFRGNVAVNNDAGFIPFARWHSQCSGGYSSTVGLGSIATGPSSWADVAITTLGDGGSAGQRIFQFTTANGDIYANAGGNLSGNYIFQKQPNCDITLKHDIKYDDGYQSYENIKKFLPATYVYNDDPRERVRRGVIAQDVMKIDSEYVKLVPAAPKFDSEGNRVDADDTLALDNNVIMLDTVLALNYVIKQLETTQKELQELKLKIAES